MPVLIAIVAIVVSVVAYRSHGRWRTIALGALPVLLAVEGLLVTAQMLPRVDEAEYYPETGLTRYLAAELDRSRGLALPVRPRRRGDRATRR